MVSKFVFRWCTLLDILHRFIFWLVYSKQPQFYFETSPCGWHSGHFSLWKPLLITCASEDLIENSQGSAVKGCKVDKGMKIKKTFMGQNASNNILVQYEYWILEYDETEQLSCPPTISACHWPQKRRWSSWWPRPSPHDRSWSCWWSTCKRTSPLWSCKGKKTLSEAQSIWFMWDNSVTSLILVILPVCNTSSRPQARWTFPQGEGDSGLLTLPAWQKVSGGKRVRRRNPSLPLVNAQSWRPSASVHARWKQFAP